MGSQTDSIGSRAICSLTLHCQIVSEDALHNPSSPLVPKTPYVSSIHPFAALKGNVSSFPLTSVTPQSAAPTANAEQDENLNPFDLIDPILGATLQRGTPLASILNELLKGVKNECKTVLDIAERLRAPGEAESTDPASTADRPGFELFGNVVWKEIGERLIDELGSTIFAIGQPDELHQVGRRLIRFFSAINLTKKTPCALFFVRTTSSFMHSLASLRHCPLRWRPSTRCAITRRTRPSRSGGNFPSTSSFDGRRSSPSLRRAWPLQSVKRSVASPLKVRRGSAFLVSSWISDLSLHLTERDGFFLSQTVATLRAMRACWAPGIIIPELSHRFWRLNLQVRIFVVGFQLIALEGPL